MKAIRTQFDTGTFSGAVATPTCSSCCCCCCCAATVSSASILGAVGSARAAKRAGLSPAQRVLAIIAAAVIPWLPVVAGVVMFIWFPSVETEEVLIPLATMSIVSYACYLGLFFWLRLSSPGSRALAVAVGLGGIFAAEFMAGLWLILAADGEVWVYLLVAALVTAGFVFLMLGLPSKIGRTGTDAVFGLPPKHVPGPPPGYSPGYPPGYAPGPQPRGFTGPSSRGYAAPPPRDIGGPPPGQSWPES
ncbi:MAG: hypothetical protein Q4B08_04540 [Propionibacteriaceae bacterium]|nr:hypothetical protein [Propionibacteriaceae bacterium]